LAAIGAAVLSAALLAAPAGANVLSPEAPQSPNAEDINTLYWIMLIVAVAVFAVVTGALLLAVRRYRERRGVEPRQTHGARPAQVRVAAALTGLAAVLFTISVVFTERARDLPASGPEGLQESSSVSETTSPPATGNAEPAASQDADPLQINATVQQWLWRYTYPNGAFSYYRLVVPVDTTVKLGLVSTDVVHGWYVPELGGKFDAVPGKLNNAWFHVDETGTYHGRGSTFSGSAYAAEGIEVEVVSPQRYETFIREQKRGIQEAQDAVAAQIEAGQTP